MDPRPPKLSRRLWGYDRKGVLQLLADRDALLRQVHERVQAADARQAELEAELQTARDEHQQLAADLQARLLAAEQDLRDRTDQLQTTQTTQADLRAELDAAREEIRRLTGQLATLRERPAQLEADLETAREEARLAEARAAEGRAELEAVRDEHRELTTELQARLLSAEQELRDGNEQLRVARAERADLEAELRTAREEIRTALTRVSEHRAELACARDERREIVTGLEERLLAVEEDLRDRTERLEAVQTQLTAAEAELRPAREEVGRLTDRLRTAEARAAEHRAELAAAADEHGEAVSVLQTRLEAVERELRDGAERLRTTEARASGLEAELRGAREETGRLSEELSAARDRHGELEAELTRPGTSVTQGGVERTGGGDRRTSDSVADEVSAILAAADQAVTRIIERSLSAVPGRDAARGDVAAGDMPPPGWRRELGGMIDSVRDEIGRTRSAIEGIPDRISDALTPLSEAMGTLEGQLSRMIGWSLRPSPGGAEPAEKAERRDRPPAGSSREDPTGRSLRVVLAETSAGHEPEGEETSESDEDPRPHGWP